MGYIVKKLQSDSKTQPNAQVNPLGGIFESKQSRLIYLHSRDNRLTVL